MKTSREHLPSTHSCLSCFLPPSRLCLPFLFLHLLLLLPFPSLAQTAVPYPAATCIDPSLLVASGLTLPPSNRPPVILERDGWAGHYLTTALAGHLLRDALGYPVEVVDVGSTAGNLTSVFSRLGTATTQMNFEVWPNSQLESDYAQFVLGGGAVNAGPLGLLQQSGWYVPSTAVSNDWYAYLDFWKVPPHSHTLLTPSCWHR